jgi:hypothetical protein
LMWGDASITLFFVESNGAIDPNLYTWTRTDRDLILDQAYAGLLWWSNQAFSQGRLLTFLVKYYDPSDSACQSSYEPIQHSSAQDYLWIDQIMNHLGYTWGSHWTKVEAFNTWQINTFGVDWAYSAFIGYNPSPAPTTLIDGYSAYAYLGGPYTQLLYRNNGWSIYEFYSVLSHESGHIFWACDEYAASGCVYNGVCSEGAHGIPNGNCENGNPDPVPCVMRSGEASAVCQYTKGHLGWQLPCDSLGVVDNTIAFSLLYKYTGEEVVYHTGLGSDVCGVPDLNGDGIEDFLIGAFMAGHWDTVCAGRIDVHSGSDGNLLYSVYGDGYGTYLGGCIASLKDINGDGKGDFVAGESDSENRGCVKVFSGADGSILHRFYGESPYDNLGSYVIASDDVNHDGKDDIVVPAFGTDPGGIQNAGSVYVYSGADWSLLHRFNGTQQDQHLTRVACGDVTGDGYADILFGANFWDAGSIANAGGVWVYSGADGSLLYSYEGDSPFDGFGNAVCILGDINLDNRLDFAFSGSETVFVCSGVNGEILHKIAISSSGTGFGISLDRINDMDKDGIADIIVGCDRGADVPKDFGRIYVFSGASGIELFYIDGEAKGDQFGRSVTGLSDIDGNGSPELMVGTSRAEHLPGENEGAGRAYIYSTKFINSICVFKSFLPDGSDPSLVGHWAFNEGTGLAAYDSTRYSNHGTLHGPAWTDGPPLLGTALEFDGIHDYVGYPVLYSSSPSAITVNAWIRSPLDSRGMIVYHGDNGEFALAAGVTDNSKINFAVKLANGLWYDINSLDVTPNVWHHVAGVWSKGNSIKVCVDGDSTGGMSVPDSYLYDPGGNYGPTIGAYNRGDDHYFDGTIDQVKIYNRALTETEIKNELKAAFICGDVNSNGAVNILDITYLINYLYKGGPPPGVAVAANVDGNGAVNILDITYLINYLYKGGPEPLCVN